MVPIPQIAAEIQPPLTDQAALTEDEKWAAVMARDATQDGTFISAVRSTGVYCKPSCPARKPAREQVVFFAGPDEAEQSGFRACRRCRPREAFSDHGIELVDRVTKYIQATLDKKVTLGALAAQIGLSPYHLQRTFKKVLGISPRQYVEARRLEKMKRSLRNGETVNNALYNAGFTSRSRIYEKGPGRLGVNPGTFRRRGKGLRIEYTIVGSPVGRLLVGATDRGLCSVCIGASDEAVEASFFEDYFAADVSRNDEGMRKWVGSFANYFDGQRFPPDLPIDVQATAFQWRVWKQIQSIPYGTTASYSDIAKSLGNPQAVRAVGRACATNPVSLLIPCHRVIGKDGSLHGYGGGIKRKRGLLSLERERNHRASAGI